LLDIGHFYYLPFPDLAGWKGHAFAKSRKLGTFLLTGHSRELPLGCFLGGCLGRFFGGVPSPRGRQPSGLVFFRSIRVPMQIAVDEGFFSLARFFFPRAALPCVPNDDLFRFKSTALLTSQRLPPAFLPLGRHGCEHESLRIPPLLNHNQCDPP